MIPWIYDRLEGTVFRRRLHLPVYGLIALLQEIGHGEIEFGATEGPGSVVYEPGGTGMYLIRSGRTVSFASFRISGRDNIVSVGLRYRDPFDPSSGLRDKREVPIIGGWQGTAELLTSAVRHSAHWKNLETIETSAELITDYHERSFDNAEATWHHTYEVWVTPTHDWCADWSEGELPNGSRWKPGAVHFDRNRPVLLAKVVVERVLTDGELFETVRGLDLYPELSEQIWDLETDADRRYGYNESEGFYPRMYVGRHPLRSCRNDCRPMDKPEPPVFMEFEERVLRFPPHSEIRVTWT